MARRRVFEVVCDRCKKVETQELADEVSTEAELVVKMRGKEEVKFQDLCLKCQRSIKGYYGQLVMQSEPDESVETKEPAEKPEPSLVKKSGLFSKVVG